MLICLNGRFLKASDAKISVFDHGFLYGDGVYETLRTYGGKVWQIDEHLRRLEKSAEYLLLKLPVSKRTLAEWVRTLVQKNGFKESRIRITLTRGLNEFDFVTSRKPTLFIVAEKLQPQPTDVYRRGVKVITVRMVRTLPEAKSTSLLPFILARQQMAQKKAYEALFIDEKNFVREGTITNVFMVKNRVLYTPKQNILAGTTRAVILKVAKKIGIKVREESVSLRRLTSANEVFITNAPRGIIPVRQVDKHVIGSGKPGSLTMRIVKEFEDYIYKTLG